MKHVVGCVPYVNAKPLIGSFEEQPENSPVRVILDVPSRLPALLDDGSAEAVLASSFEALATPGRSFAEGCGILNHGNAASVRLFSKVPPDRIESMALDQSSLTSNHLARVLLNERYGVEPHCAPEAPNLGTMLGQYDACILIGDIGMRTEGDGLHVLDLGGEWTAHTGLPFVWALWIGKQDLCPELVSLLNQAVEWGEEHREEIVQRTWRAAGWPEEVCREYLTHTMQYRMTPQHLQGLRTFKEKLVQHGFAPDIPMPQMVRSSVPLGV